MTGFFNQKVVIITGSSMGIGKSLALLLANRNAKIVLNARNEERLLATEKELKDAGYEVISFAGDVTLETDCRNLIATAIARYGKIDILVNNAGISMRGAIENLSPHVISTVFNINAIAPLMLTQMVLPYIKQTKGSIIFISSLAGLRGIPFLSVYSAAKMALTSISQSLRVEHHADGIHIGLVYVGITEIEKNKTAMDADGSSILLDERKGFFTSGVNHVSYKIARLIAARKKQTVIGISGKAYYFLIKYFPSLVGFLMIQSQKRMKKLYK